MSSKGKSGGATIIIKKEEVVEGGHHGGAWKVAYADFVTAMMAFFLLMWLLNATTEDQRKGLADYFAPAGAMAHQTSGSGAPFGGRTPFDTGSLVSDRGAMTIKAGKATAMVAPDDADSETSMQLAAPRMIDDDGDPASAQLARTPRPGAKGAAGTQGEEMGAKEGTIAAGAGPGRRDAATDRADAQAREAAEREKAREQRQEQQAFERAANQLRDAIRADPALAGLAKQLTIDLTPEGLRIQLLDEDKQAMFASGSSAPNERARLLLQKIAPVLAKLPEPIAITGHTDAQPYRGGDRSNWELSSERANATRRLLLDAGLQDDRMRSVSGTADRDLLLPADPLAAANRRIAIMVMRRGRLSDPPADTARAEGAPPPAPGGAPATTPAIVQPGGPPALAATPASPPPQSARAGDAARTGDAVAPNVPRAGESAPPPRVEPPRGGARPPAEAGPPPRGVEPARPQPARTAPGTPPVPALAPSPGPANAARVVPNVASTPDRRPAS